MPSPTMRSTVLQTTALYVASLLFVHHTSDYMFSEVVNDPVVANFTAAFMPPNNSVTTTPYTKEGVAVNQSLHDSVNLVGNGKEANRSLATVTITNGTSLNETLSAIDKQPESFYKKTLPVAVFGYLVVCTLQYYWLVWLERILPARPRKRDAIVKEKVEMSEDREEEVVKKWIAQGRVRRASLNWCNTFLKWILHLTIGRLWWHAVLHVIGRPLIVESPKELWDGMLMSVLFDYVGSFVSITALAELIAFVIVPAYKQSVFVAGVDVASQIFAVTVVKLFASWAVKTEFAQALMRDMTDSMTKSREEAERYRRYKNEL